MRGKLVSEFEHAATVEIEDKGGTLRVQLARSDLEQIGAKESRPVYSTREGASIRHLFAAPPATHAEVLGFVEFSDEFLRHMRAHPSNPHKLG